MHNNEKTAPVKHHTKVNQMLTHQPVMLNEVIELLAIAPTDQIVDGTLGLGGHSLAFASILNTKGHLYGFDLDESNLKQAQENLKKYDKIVTFFRDSYANIKNYFNKNNFKSYNKALLDLGLSSPHLDDQDRGFSFKHNGPLDMRFDRTTEAQTAADLVATAAESELQQIFRNYGELSNYKKVANVVVQERELAPFKNTTDFAERLMKNFHPKDKNRLLAQIFQSLRIAVNNELEVLKSGLINIWENLSPNGRFAIMSYHSLEDRIVKQFFAPMLKSCHCPRELPKCICTGLPAAQAITKKIVVPTAEEIAANPRARSAKLRVYQKLT